MYVLHAATVRVKGARTVRRGSRACCTSRTSSPARHAVPGTLCVHVQRLTPENVYALSDQLESLLAYHTLPQPLT